MLDYSCFIIIFILASIMLFVQIFYEKTPRRGPMMMDVCLWCVFLNQI